MLTVSLDMLRRPAPAVVRWPESAYAVFALVLEGGEGSLGSFDRRVGGWNASVSVSGEALRAEWKTPAGQLAVSGATRVAEVGRQDLVFREELNGRPVPLVRLSDERLA